MKTTILPNGNLEVSLESDDDRAEIAGWGIHWERLFEQKCENGWRTLAPEDIGALTDAPIVTDDYDLSDHGDVTSVGRVWWFPNYAVEDPIATLVTSGRVVFTFAK